MADKETKYRNTRETGLSWLANLIPGGVAKAKQDHKKKLEEQKKKAGL